MSMDTLTENAPYDVVCYSKRTGQDIYVVGTEPDLYWARKRCLDCIVSGYDAPDADVIGYYVRGDSSETFQAAIRSGERSTSFAYFPGVSPAQAYAAAVDTVRAWCLPPESLEAVSNDYR